MNTDETMDPGSPARSQAATGDRSRSGSNAATGDRSRSGSNAATGDRSRSGGGTDRTIDAPGRDRMMRRQQRRYRRTGFFGAAAVPAAKFFAVATALLVLCNGGGDTPPLQAAMVYGTLKDVGLAGLATSLTFTPTNLVLVTTGGLQIGPPKTISTVSTGFSLTLDAGDYWVRAPLVPTRSAFKIAVPNATNSYNITSLLSAPLSYIYSNLGTTYTNNGNSAGMVVGDGIGTNTVSGILDQVTGTGLQVLRRTGPNTGLEFATVSFGGGDLIGANNLRDVSSTNAARSNLWAASITDLLGRLTNWNPTINHGFILNGGLDPVTVTVGDGEYTFTGIGHYNGTLHATGSVTAAEFIGAGSNLTGIAIENITGLGTAAKSNATVFAPSTILTGLGTAAYSNSPVFSASSHAHSVAEIGGAGSAAYSNAAAFLLALNETREVVFTGDITFTQPVTVTTTDTNASVVPDLTVTNLEIAGVPIATVIANGSVGDMKIAANGSDVAVAATFRQNIGANDAANITTNNLSVDRLGAAGERDATKFLSQSGWSTVSGGSGSPGAYNIADTTTTNDTWNTLSTISVADGWTVAIERNIIAAGYTNTGVSANWKTIGLYRADGTNVALIGNEELISHNPITGLTTNWAVRCTPLTNNTVLLQVKGWSTNTVKWHDFGNANPVSHPVSLAGGGGGGSPVFSFVPASYGFGNRLTNTSDTKVFYVTNTGTASGGVIVTLTNTPFTLALGGTSTNLGTLAAGAGVNFTANYDPITVGASNGTLWISGTAVNAALTGTGTNDVVAGCTTVKDGFWVNDTISVSAGQYGSAYFAFTNPAPASSYTICKMGAVFTKTGTPTFNIRIGIWNNSSGLPGVQLGTWSDYVVASNITDSVETIFANVSAARTNGTPDWIVMQVTAVSQAAYLNLRGTWGDGPNRLYSGAAPSSVTADAQGRVMVRAYTSP